MSKSSIMERALINYIDYLDLKYAEKVSREINEGKMKTYSWE